MRGPGCDASARSSCDWVRECASGSDVSRRTLLSAWREQSVEDAAEETAEALVGKDLRLKVTLEDETREDRAERDDGEILVGFLPWGQMTEHARLSGFALAWF